MMNIRPLIAIAMACLFAVGSVHADDTLVLKDGTTRKGTVIHRGNTYTVVVGKKLYQYYIRDVKEVNGEPVAIDPNPVALIKTDEGDIKVELYETEAPNTVANFITLAEKGFYKGQAFHRIIPGFMAQGGCPNSKEGADGVPGQGGPGYKIRDEISPRLQHNGRGILSMAKTAAPNSGGSQFFLCFGPTPHLDGKHTVFGRVIEGIEVLDKLEAVGTKSGKPTKTIRFDVQILSKGKHEYKVTKISAKPRPRITPTMGK